MSQVTAIIGLGNPGAEYDATRHNAGFWLVDAIARSAHTELRPEKKFLGLYAKARVGDHELHLLNPTTFMNRSGAAVAALTQFFKLTPDNLLVAHDELDLPPGQSRYKTGGGHGGHNGLRDTIAHLGTNDFQRLRLGIGHPGDSRKVTGFVLGRLGKQETEQLTAVFDEVMRVLPDAASGKLAAAMNRLHSFKPTP